MKEQVRDVKECRELELTLVLNSSYRNIKEQHKKEEMNQVRESKPITNY